MCFGGGESEVSDIKMPEWYEDPLYKSSQEYLDTFGKNILEGKLPDFYKSLGQTNSSEFQDLLNMTNKDTAKAVNENLVRRNISRSGVGLSTTAKATANTGTTLRWSDFLRASGEKAGLLTTGLNVETGVRSAALDITGKRNQFNLGVTDLALKQAGAEDAAQAQEDAMWGSILTSAIGGAAMIASMGMLAPAVAGVGAAGAASGAGVMGSAGFGLGASQASIFPAFAMASSITLKKDVSDISNSLDIVKRLRGVKFSWKDNDMQDGGVIAEELEKVLADAVTEINGVKHVKPMMIIGYLIEAVKDLSDKLERKG